MSSNVEDESKERLEEGTDGTTLSSLLSRVDLSLVLIPLQNTTRSTT